MMPKNVKNYPVFFTDKEKTLLKGCSILNMIDKEIRDISKDYLTICQEIPEFKNKFTLEQYKEARTMVKSKAISMEIEGTQTRGLIPFADLFNHKDGSK